MSYPVAPRTPPGGLSGTLIVIVLAAVAIVLALALR
jgi:hypothetical protein